MQFLNDDSIYKGGGGAQHIKLLSYGLISWFNNNWESSKEKTTANQREHRASSHICQRNILVIFKTKAFN